MRSGFAGALWAAVMFAAAVPLVQSGSAQRANPNQPDSDLPGRAIYEQNCATCHDNPGDTRAASFEALTAMGAMQIYQTISEGGVMAPMAAHLSMTEKRALIEYLVSGQTTAEAAADWTEDIMCPASRRSVDTSAPAAFPTFGVDSSSTRWLPAHAAGLAPEDMASLKVAWAVGLPQTNNVSQAPVEVGDTLFFNGGGRLAAMDAASGCVKWSYEGGPSRSPLTYGSLGGRPAILYAVNNADIVAVDAETGAEIWKVSGNPKRGDGGRVRPGVVLHEDKVIVPISASGVGGGGDYCCTGHGAVVALNAADGSWLWEYHTMEEATDNGFVNSEGQKQRGPSGAPIWSQPTIDAKRNRVIVTTGENTSQPATGTSDAIIALDLGTGEEEWVFQAMEADVWNMQCRTGDDDSGPNCPWHFEDDNPGRDFDFGGSAVLVTSGGRDLLLAGQKSGHLWALDAETGTVVWEQRVGTGTALGGNHWGIAADDERAYLTINDPTITAAGTPRPGIFAFNIADGTPAWSFEAQADCDGARGKAVVNCEAKHGFSATPLVVGGAVVAGTLDGKLYAFDAETGNVLTMMDTVRAVETLNAVDAKGGSIDSHALAAGRGRIYLGSGYGSFNQTPGNVFMALEPGD